MKKMSGRSGYQKHAIGCACVGLLWVVAASCSFDEREVQLTGLGGDAGGGASTEILALTPLLEVRPSSVDLGAVTTGFASRARLTITNGGTGALAPPLFAWADGNPADYEIIQNQCLSEVPPGASCDVRVQLVPSRVGVVAAALDISNATGSPVRVPFSGEGLVAGDLILAPAVGSFEDFGGALVGGMREATFGIMNPSVEPSGTLSFRLNRPEFALLPALPGECVPGTTVLAGGQVCNVRIAFAPTERGPLEATLTATTIDAGSVSLNLTGTGLIPGVLEASSEAVDFGGVVLTSSGLSNVHFVNEGDEALSLGGARLEPLDVGEFSITNSTCGAGTSLAAGVGCDVALEFRPTLPGQERSAELVLDVTGGDALRVGLVGHGLEQGVLALQASLPGEENFGDVLLDTSVSRVFSVSNPGAQPSGVLSLAAGGAFELAAVPEAGDCVDGTTSLATGDSCTVRLSFKPTLRQVETGALTVSSELAGANRLTLTGRGILAATFEAVDELNFGRVLTNATAERTISVKNAGDEPLPPPAVLVAAGSEAQTAAFSVVNSCTAPLAFGEECSITVTFAPSDAVPHSANLNLSSEPGGTASVLLLGEALTPGSLVLAVENGTSDFGDVPLGTTVSRSFTLSNPGNEASGLLTITTDDSRFLVGLGDCNQGAPEGLVDGSSCTFTVAFAPDGSEPAVASISVQSSGAGRAGLAIRGRGRSPAALRATGTRDLGRANIGRPTTAANRFTWTVNNDGDLASGALAVTRGSVAEFQIIGDTCSGAQLAGVSTCQMDISFAPAEPPGPRTESIVVTDTVSGVAVTLALTAQSVRVAGPGQSCINAECETGMCTDGVCCDRACDRTCQQCSAAGVCVDQASQEACGTGAARCFGVDQCQLPAGQACVADTDCGGGTLCKACSTGGRQCTAPAACCGPCEGNETCVGGTCGCTDAQIDCGGGLCIPGNLANVCCPSQPDCPTNLPGCTNDGRCVQCVTDGHCGPCSTCNAATNTCTPRGRGAAGVACPAGQVCDGSGACFPPECNPTGPNTCGNCRTCQNFACGNAANDTVCQGNGECFNGTCLPGANSACQAGGTPCANNLPCVGGVCQLELPTVGNLATCGAGIANCDASVGLTCQGAGVGVCGCAGQTTFAQGRCSVSDGQPCPTNGAAGCASRICTEWLVDADADGFGSFGDALGGVDAQFRCGAASAANAPPPFEGPGCRGGVAEYSFVAGDQDGDNSREFDCCDLDYKCGFVGFGPNEVQSTLYRPDQTAPQAGVGAGPLGTGCAPPGDYNCDNAEVPVSRRSDTGTVTPCALNGGCAEIFNKVACAEASVASCTQNSGITGEPRCGIATFVGCTLNAAGDACTTAGAGQVRVLCL
jgi:hypothetical protein